ncbi:uncharacterized protein LOC129721678 [Wyeomyia smithii]|uniref:uncharacterized protein LOC129721678 n=1 Tax=Wyeomyia smithii TaxID=174621 RepID=UPI00246815C9|nr:uncharacterized protein LOC129721678 [Wyeomyia smithii]
MSCCVRGCWSRYGKDKVSFHRIPQNNEERRQRWIEILDRGDQINYNSAMVCSRHFVGGWPAKAQEKTAANWIPTLFLGRSEDSQATGSATMAPNAPVREVYGDSDDIRCMVRGCGMTKEDNPSLLFFPIPRDQEERGRWLQQIGMHNDPSLAKADNLLAVCELHFDLAKDLMNYDDVISMGRTAVLKDQVKPTRNIPLLMQPKAEMFEDDAVDTGDTNQSLDTDVSFMLQEMNRTKEDKHSNLLAQYPEHLQTSPILEEYVQVCRSCLSTNIANLVSAFDDNLNDIYYQFTSIAIDDSAGISTMFCVDCKHRLLEMHFFRDNCVTSTQILFHRQQKAFGSSSAHQQELEDDDNSLLVPMHESHNMSDYTANGSSFGESMQTDDPEDLLMPQREEPDSVVSPPKRNIPRSQMTQVAKSSAAAQPLKSMKKRFKCKVCHKEYNSKAGIDMHMSSHEGDNPSDFTIACNRCHVLRRPQDKHSCMVETMYCHVCGDKFRSWSYLKLHLAKTHRIKTKRRELLQKLANDKQIGVSNRLLKSPPIRTVIVPAPDLVEDSSGSQGSAHTPKHKMMKCTFCSASFKHAASLDVHMRSHSAVQQTQCHECGENFPSYRKLEKHFDKHPNEILGAMYKCAICGNIYSRRQTLLMHRQYVHRDRDVVQCGGCSKLYAHTKQLADHKCFPKRQEPSAGPVPVAVTAASTTTSTENTINGDFVIVRPESILKGVVASEIIDADEENSVPVAMQEGNADPLLGLGNEEVIELESDDESAPEPIFFNCTVCDKSFDKSDVLDRHMKLHRMMNAAKANEIGPRK